MEQYDEPLKSRRKFVRNLRRSLEIASSALRAASEGCLRQYDRVPQEIDQAVIGVREMLVKLKTLSNVRRLGVGNPIWVLAHLEAHIEQAVGRTPPAKILSGLVKAGRAASGRPSTSWDSAEVIKKNLRNFKMRKENKDLMAVLPLSLPPTLLSLRRNQRAKLPETNPLR